MDGGAEGEPGETKVARATLAPPKKWMDLDGDGIRDAQDKCVDQKEDPDNVYKMLIAIEDTERLINKLLEDTV